MSCASDKMIVLLTVDSQDAALDVEACHRHHTGSHGAVEGELSAL